MRVDWYHLVIEAGLTAACLGIAWDLVARYVGYV